MGYRRVSPVDRDTLPQLEGQTFDVEFEDSGGGKDAKRTELKAMLKQVGKGDTVVCDSMDRFARNLSDLRAIVLELIKRGVSVEFVKESLMFSSEDDAKSKQLLNMMGAFADFERSLILERRREGIAVAKTQGKYKGRKAKLSPAQANDLRKRAEAGESKTALAREFGISRETLYTYLRRPAQA